MGKTAGGAMVILVVLVAALGAQQLSAKWEELTAADFVQALQQSRATCALPFGILEKHGPAGVLGTDLINVRFSTLKATTDEYVIVFPEYYAGQIFEAKHQPGTIAYSTHLQLEMLQETVAEMARNGCRKIVIVNGHGGNNALIQYFAQIQLESPKDYVVYTVAALGGPQGTAAAAPSRPGVDGHAGEGEVSNLMASRPELAHPERSATESGADLNRLELPEGVYTGIWWYAKFPNHYQGDSTNATATRGRAATDAIATRIANAFRAIKRDEVGPRLQKEFFERATKPRL
ncbi:MAG TPA: creatininase family protein [Vicinamibacterales bacterium]|nr:creatininase family protein [Vicinamibacterales bacterium]